MKERGGGRQGKKRGDRHRKGGEGEREDWQMGGVRREKTTHREWVEREDKDCVGVHIAGGRRGEEREEGRREGERENDSERERGWSVWLRKREK